MTEKILKYYEYWFENERDYISAYSMQEADGIYCMQILAFAKGSEEREMTRKEISKEQAESMGFGLFVEFEKPGVMARFKV
jgi:hypothetical protein